MAAAKTRNALKRVRHERRLGQGELASQAGISRQALSEIEAGRSCPSTAVALQLSKALRCTVEDLFSLEEDSGTLRARWVGPRDPLPHSHQNSRRNTADQQMHAGAGSWRVALGLVGGRWVAHSLVAEHPASLCIAADGLVRPAKRIQRAGERRDDSTVTVAPLRDRGALRENILAIGCDPALGLLSAWLGERHPESRVIWLHAPSMAALGILAQGGAHVAGAHLLDEKSRDFNVPFVRSFFPHRPMVVINVARWEEGFVVHSGNPLRIRTIQDVARAKVRFINREAGSGARRLFDRLLAETRTAPTRVDGYQRVAAGHLAVAQAVAMGLVDVGIATRASSLAQGLDFIPLAEERSDLVIPQELIGDSRVARMIDALGSRAFRRELASLGGYQVSESGHIVEELRAQ